MRSEVKHLIGGQDTKDSDPVARLRMTGRNNCWHPAPEQSAASSRLRLARLPSILALCTFVVGATPPAFAHPGFRLQTEQAPPPSAPPAPSQSQAPPPPVAQSPATGTPQSQPTDSGQAQPTPAASEGVKLEPAQLSALLHKIYLAAFRFADLLSILQTDKWKMDDATRQSFNQTLETTRGQLKTLEEDRQRLLQNPENSDLADKTDAAITDLLPNIDAVAAAVTQYDSAAQGAQYKQPGDQLRELQQALRPYVLYLRPKVAAAQAPNLPGPGAPQALSEPAAQTPQTSAPQPSAQAAQAQQAQPRQTQPTSAGGEGVKLESAQLSALLHKVYLAAFRFTDLLSILQTDKWNMDDVARQSFNQTLGTARGQLKILEEDRQRFLQNPENSDVADKTDAAITGLLPNIDAVASAVTQYDSAAQGAQYKQPGNQLHELQQALRPYVLYLHAKAEAALAPAPGLQTEVIQSAPTPKAILLPTDTSGPPPPLQPEQLKEFLYRMYAVAYRIRDLLSQEQPEKWKGPDAERSTFNRARETLRARLAEFEKARSLFAASPESGDLAFQTYRALNSLQEPLEQVSSSVSANEDARQADQYRQPERELAAGQQTLVTYISYFLDRWDRAVQMFQNNLAACQNQLSYAMHSRVQAATPLPNVNPEFRGHPRKKPSRKQTATIPMKKNELRKSAKPSAK